MKKILSLVLALMMVFSVVPAVFAADAVTSAQASPYQDAIEFLDLLDLYDPAYGSNSDGVTRWQMALFVARILTGKTDKDNAYWATNENNSGFADVEEYLNAEQSYIVGAISYASNVGIVNGYGDGTFGPNDGITYRDALTMIVRALGISYPAAGYPWSYVTKADELGIMAGITGIGQTDEISREVVAQILYNALNADVNGVTLVEKAYGVGEMIVMVTASNNISYESSAKVARTDYVQFSAIDDQGEPTGAKYHIPMAKLGLANAKAADLAVGTNYKITYKNNCADVIKAEALWATYENFAATNTKEITVATNTTTGAKTVALAGQATVTLVDKYTNLFNTQGTLTGLVEAKYYGATNAAGDWKTIGDKYYMDAQGYIYEIKTLSLVAYYFDFFNTLYAVTVESTGKYTYDQIGADLEALIRADLFTANAKGCTVIKAANVTLAASAYTKAIATDSNGDGQFDRVTIKDYKFGKVTQADANTWTFTPGATLNAWGTATNVAKANVTGKAVANGNYVIYNIDPITGYCDVAVVVDADKADNTYYASAYLLGFSVANNVVYMQDTKAARFDLPFGYATLNNAPIYAFGTNASQNNALIDLFLGLQEQYITYVVVDGKIVYITAAEESSDYVVIKEFTSITADGIFAKAYSTIANEYVEIKVAEYNGWNVAGFDWESMWMEILVNAFMTGTAPGEANGYLAKLLPVKANELYKVIYANGNEYNLRPVTDADLKADADSVHVLKQMIHWFKDGQALSFDTNAIAKYTVTNAAHNWLVLQVPYVDDTATVKEYDVTAIEEVYVVNGKVADMYIENFGLYKFADNDFVIVATEEELADFIRSQTVSGSSEITYVYYQKYDLAGQDHNNMWVDLGEDVHYYYMWMRNFMTGNMQIVAINKAEAVATRAAIANLGTNAAILKLVDGVLSLTDTNSDKIGDRLDVYTVADVAAHYGATSGTVAITAFTASTAADADKMAGDALDQAVLGTTQGYVADQDYFGATKITFYGLDATGAYVKVAGSVKSGTNGEVTTTGDKFNGLTAPTVYVFYAADFSYATVFVG